MRTSVANLTTVTRAKPRRVRHAGSGKVNTFQAIGAAHAKLAQAARKGASAQELQAAIEAIIDLAASAHTVLAASDKAEEVAMSIKVNTLGAWTQVRNTLVQNLQSTLAFLEDEPFSADPASAFQQAEDQADKLLVQLRALAVTGLKQIDEQVAQGTLLADITAAATEAKKEADKLKNAAKTIDGIVRVVDGITSIVTKIGGLPFL